MKLPENGGGSFEKCPQGNHLAVCYEVIDLGTQETNFGQKHEIWIGWETPAETMEDGRPYVIGRRYTLSANEKSNLRKDLESWRGTPFKDSDFGAEGTFEIQSIIGKGCMLNVVHSESGDRTYANVSTVAPLPKGMNVPEPVNEKTFLSLDPDEFDLSTFDRLSDRMKETVGKSPEYAAINGTPPPTPGMPPVPVGADDDGEDSPF